MAESGVQVEARRLAVMHRAQARAEFGDRVGRSFLLAGAEFVAALDFNARLVTELRDVIPSFWRGW